MKKAQIVFLCIFILFVFAVASYAAGSSGATMIQSVSVQSNGAVFVITPTPHLNPDGCSRADVLAITDDNPIRKELLAIVLTAQSADKSVTSWLNGCYNFGTSTYPIVRSMNIE